MYKKNQDGNLVKDCYNFSNIESSIIRTGGICGINQPYCSIKKCYISNKIIIKGKSDIIANNINGTSTNNYTGQIIGNATTNCISEENKIIENIPSIYNILTQYIEKDENGNIIPSPWIDKDNNRPELNRIQN